jgi:hypothetical protein
MIIKRNHFFLMLFLLMVVPIIAAKLYWVSSASKTKGVMAFQGKEISGQLRRTYAVITFSATGKDTVFFNSADDESFSPGQSVPVLYQRSRPTEAKVDTFTGLWMDTVIYSGLFFLFISGVFFHTQNITKRARVQLLLKRPFIKLV